MCALISFFLSRRSRFLPGRSFSCMNHFRRTVLEHTVNNHCIYHESATCFEHKKSIKRNLKQLWQETSSIKCDYLVAYKRRYLRGNVYYRRVQTGEIMCHSVLSTDLLRRLCTPMSIELCISEVESMKHIFKYAHKGSDRVGMEIMIAWGKERNSIYFQKPCSNWRDTALLVFAKYFFIGSGVKLIVTNVVHHSSTDRWKMLIESRLIANFKEEQQKAEPDTSRDESTKLMALFYANVRLPNDRHLTYSAFPKYSQWNK